MHGLGEKNGVERGKNIDSVCNIIFLIQRCSRLDSGAAGDCRMDGEM